MSNEQGEKVNILIVDDQDENRFAFGAVLENLGQNIVHARSGEEALRHLYKEDYAVILLDVRMPVMDGFETATYIRTRPRSRHIPIIFVTAFDDTLDRISQGYSLGAVDYIMKPVNSDILRSKVKVFVELAQKSKSLEREVSERLRVEAELRSSNQELEAFSYSVSHDLRSPLRAIRGFGQILASDYLEKPLDRDARQYIRRICEGAQQMDDLIENLLAFSRIAREKIECTSIDPAEAVSAALAQVALTQAEVQCDTAFPKVLGHQVLLTQVLANLLTNAAKFVRPGVRPVIRVRGETNGERTRIWVEDNGIGIAPEYHERIFQVFERLHSGADYSGTGIGLAIVRRGMERMEGKCGVESLPDQGSRFWIEFPRPRIKDRSELEKSASNRLSLEGP
jgi:two-component system sensor histidine kinase/response regulator